MGCSRPSLCPLLEAAKPAGVDSPRDVLYPRAVVTSAHVNAEFGDHPLADPIVAADDNPMLIWVADAEQACTWCNRTWLRFTGRTLDQERSLMSTVELEVGTSGTTVRLTRHV